MLAKNLKAILVHKFLVESDLDSSTILEEENGMKVEVIQTPQEAVTTKLRKASHLPLVEDGRLKQICDYLVIFSNGKKNIAIFIELKKTLGENKKPKEQLRRSLPILEYLSSICRVEFGVKGNEVPTVRYFLIGEKFSSRLDKQRVRSDSKVEKENYENIEIHTFVGNRISFDKLIC